MKQFLLFSLACCFPFLLSAQAVELKVYANSELQESVTEVAKTIRFSLMVEDGARRDGSHAYDFGAITAYRVNDSGREKIGVFRAAKVENGPVTNFTIGPQQNPELIGTIDFEIEYIQRYNPDKTMTDLALTKEQRTIRVVVHE